jgi:hypothetical protein
VKEKIQKWKVKHRKLLEVLTRRQPETKQTHVSFVEKIT